MNNEELTDELNTLTFWESIMEQNYDTRKLIQEFAKLREQYANRIKKDEAKIEKLQ